ncbi:hypothetical protein DGo_PD0070 (plasmid) [Deinococcus gobiensis I-0]|uniref:Uncharacterized protein n=1 Tax=Deinococcus gobiensis (strain DSM 21396 / JCM 16679 / CGMCC 1.7299 / I-0) TaxID=745776 RepID=H8H3P7_DEIGI|nr:hypothetical protein DGo_PD0070 [Deinococcus gobiensis I-0]
MTLNGQGFERLLVLDSLRLLSLPGQVDGPLQGEAFPLRNQAQDDSGYRGTAGMALQGDQVRGAAVVTFLSRPPVGAEALDQRLGDLPLEGTELSSLAAARHAAFDLLCLSMHDRDPVRRGLRLPRNGRRRGRLAQEDLSGRIRGQVDSSGLLLQHLTLEQGALLLLAAEACGLEDRACGLTLALDWRADQSLQALRQECAGREQRLNSRRLGVARDGDRTCSGFRLGLELHGVLPKALSLEENRARSGPT